MSEYNIMVVDDEPEIRKLIARYLKLENMDVIEVEDGQEVFLCLQKNKVDLIILDIMLEKMDGFEVLTRLRKQGCLIPVIFLTARKEDNDKVLGLGLGGDDYVTKPFSPSELLARIKAHLRRWKINNNKEKNKIVEQGPFIMDLNKYSFLKDGKVIDLTAREFQLLKFFMEHPEQVFTKQQLYKNVWGHELVDNNSVMVYIRHLREKIEENDANPVYLQTVWGIGYRFSVAGE